MADTEVNTPDPQEGQQAQEPQSNTPATKEYSDTEKRAIAQGWVPKDEWDGHGKWRDAEEFLDRGELFSKIDEQNRKLRNTEQTLEQMKVHLKKVRETEYNRALATLKAQKKAALEDGDADRVVEIDDQIADTKVKAAHEMQQIEARQQAQAGPDVHFVAWVNRNQWYQNDRAMRGAADAIGEELAQSGLRNPTDILAEVEKRIKKEFPHKFNNPNREKAGSVDGGGNSKGQKNDSFQLTPEETQAMNKFIRAGLLTKEEYIADIKAQRGA